MTAKQLFGAHAPPAPYEGMSAFEELERAVGPLDVVHLFQPWAGYAGNFHPDWLRTAAQGGRTVLLTWEPWDLAGGVEQPAYTAARIASGDHDAHIRRWADGLANLGLPIYLRPLHEMNGTWYPWAAGAPGGSPEAVVEAWRHIRDLFAAAGAIQVRWVWSPYSVDVPTGNRFEACYPGHDAVDVLGIDGYNWGAGRPEYGGWRGVDEVFGSAYERLTRLGPQPVWIAEVGCSPNGGDKAGWVADLLAPDRFPRRCATVWFHINKEEDWLLTSPPAAAHAWRRAAEALRAQRLG